MLAHQEVLSTFAVAGLALTHFCLRQEHPFSPSLNTVTIAAVLQFFSLAFTLVESPTRALGSSHVTKVSRRPCNCKRIGCDGSSPLCPFNAGFWDDCGPISSEPIEELEKVDVASLLRCFLDGSSDCLKKAL
jgi:hypothetical protein|mmetsp:Transcript_23366/g.37264  ORF Transcript_23366/g.37264 Transcript_23366/m.37264 type:complete len:132 (-) Transcript_23366:271-666(-)